LQSCVSRCDASRGREKMQQIPSVAVLQAAGSAGAPCSSDGQ